MVNEIDKKKALEQSKNAFRKSKVVYEMALHHITDYGLQLFVRADILRKVGRKFDLIEVKSSTIEKETHLWDIAFQAYVMRKCNRPINRLYLMKPSKEYRHGNDFDVADYFNVDDVTDLVIEYYLPRVERILGKIYNTLNNKREPQKVLGSHCKNPWGCPYAHHCKKNINVDSVEKLSRISNKKRKAFRKLNIKYIQQIPENELKLRVELGAKKILSPKQQIQLDVAISGKDFINEKAIKAFIKSVKFPIYHLDFEAYNKAIPSYKGMKPHQFVTFQASLHKEAKNGSLKHFEFLQDDNSDPRMNMINFLLGHLEKRGSIMVYNKSFEQCRIKDLAKDYPEYADDLLALNDRMVDLEVPFKKDYYTHSFEGRSSIKKVLPVMVSELSYDRLNIQNGADAQAIYRKLIKGDYHEDDGSKGEKFFQVRKDLLEYCKLDTLAMVEIFRKLKLLVD